MQMQLSGGYGSTVCFVEAGLPGPMLALEAAVVGGPEAPAWAWANLVRGVVPVMERLGVATAAEVDANTLDDRLLADVWSEEGIVIGPPMVGVWAQARSDSTGRRPVSP